MNVPRLRDTGHNLGAGTDVQLLENALNMGTDRPKSDLKDIGDLLISPTLQEQPEHFLLAAGQADGGGGVGDTVTKGFDHPPGDLVTGKKIARGFI